MWLDKKYLGLILLLPFLIALTPGLTPVQEQALLDEVILNSRNIESPETLEELIKGGANVNLPIVLEEHHSI